MKLEHGTEKEHRETLERAKKNKISYIWSGQLRNQYLRENIQFGQFAGIIEIDFVENREAQESGYKIKFLE